MNTNQRRESAKVVWEAAEKKMITRGSVKMVLNKGARRWSTGEEAMRENIKRNEEMRVELNEGKRKRN